MLEKDIEAYLVKRAREIGGVAYKFTSPSRRSVPDRLVVLPDRPPFFVELKAPGKKSTKRQVEEQRKLRAMGQIVFSDVDSKDKVEDLLEEVELRPGWL